MKVRITIIVLAILLFSSSLIVDAESLLTGPLAWNFDSTFLAIGTDNGVYILDAEGLIVEHFIASESPITAVIWGTNSDEIIYGTLQGNVIVYNFRTDEAIYTFDLHSSHLKSMVVTSLVFNPTNELLAIGGLDWNIYIWDYDVNQIVKTLEYPLNATGNGPDMSYTLLSWSPDGKLLATDGNISSYIWDAETGEVTSIIDIEGYGWVLRWSKDQNTIAFATNKGVSLYNPITAEIRELYSIIESSNIDETVFSITWKPDSKQIAGLYNADWYEEHQGIWLRRDGIYIWNVETNELVFDLNYVSRTQSNFYYDSFKWSPDGSRFAAVSEEDVFIWDSEAFIIIASTDLYTD